MTGQLAARQPDVRSFESAVRRADGREIVLEETYFYAESGGQPADRGTLGGVPVVDVRIEDGEVVHALTDDPTFREGDAVTGAVDDEFRTYCMRAHTASHVLYGAGRRLLDDLGYGGFDIDAGKVRVDFRTSTDIDGDVLAELERLTNRAVWDSRPVTWEGVPAEAAYERERVAFNARTEEGVLADADEVRIVTVGSAGGAGDGDDWDVAACGGTHVSNTREIGPIEVFDRSNPGEGLTRVEFAVGPAAIDRRAERRRAATEAARTLGTNVPGLPEEIRSLREERESLADELAERREQLLVRSVGEFGRIEREGATWAVGTIDGFGPNQVGDVVRDLAGDGADADAIVAAGEDGSTFLVVGAAPSGPVAAGDVVEAVTEEFGGGGGGGPTFAQGGGLDATPTDVIGSLRD